MDVFCPFDLSMDHASGTARSSGTDGLSGNQVSCLAGGLSCRLGVLWLRDCSNAPYLAKIWPKKACKGPCYDP